MSILQDRLWKLKYTPDHGDLVKLLYEPALESAIRYDRLTGYFSASALALAARGIEGLVVNGGRMRMVVGCTLHPPEIAAIEKGEELRAQVAQHLAAMPLVATDADMGAALELLAWMVARGLLDVRVGIPCDDQRRPIPAEGLFHEKAGIVEDKTGDRLAFNGSLNETAAGWTRNWESLNVFTSWRDLDRVIEEDANFAKLWAGQAKHVITLDVPTAVRDDLLRFLPTDDVPARLTKPEVTPALKAVTPPAMPETVAPAIDLRKAVWDFIAVAPRLLNGGVNVGEATSAVTPWPHQVRAFRRMYDNWPPKLLIADEVGLGKTVQAGLLLRQAWLAGRAKRILVMAPKNVCSQWQIELREKFNLNWPIYDGQKLNWIPSPAMQGNAERTDADLTEMPTKPSPLTMDDLEQVIGKPKLLPPGIEVETMGAHEFKLRAPGMKDWIRISTNPSYYEQHADAMELWSPGNPTFPDPEAEPSAPHVARLAELLA